MSKTPFFTGDSTTWLVGTQYGELNWFDGRKMKRLKKDKWKREYKQKYLNLGAKEDLFEEENPYELIRINLIVFKQAEDYIRKRIRGKSYWMLNKDTPIQKKRVSIRRKQKPKEEVTETPKEETPEKIVAPGEGDNKVIMDDNKPLSKFEEFQQSSGKVETRDLDSQMSLIPSLDWFEGEMDDYNDLVHSLGLDVNGNDKEYVTDFLYNVALFLRDTEELDDIEEDDILQVATFYLNREYTELSKAIEDLTEFFKDNIILATKSAFPRQTNMTMEAPERAKERDEYLEDEEFEVVDVSEQELMNMLPPPKEDGSMPEVDELDKELAKTGIIAVRDEKGRFLKGQKRVRKPKNIYSDKFPKLACNTCYKAGDCPEYKPDHVCAYDKIFKNFDVRNTDDIMDAMSSMVNMNLGRMQRQMMFETMDGGMADGVVTSMIDQNVNLLMKLKHLQDATRTPVATQHRVINSDGSMQETTTVTNPTGGILSQIFGSTSSNDEEEEVEKPRKDIIDVEVTEDNGD